LASQWPPRSPPATKDMLALRFGAIDDGALVFTRAERPASKRA
jgi:hypothetical protein